MTHEQMRRCKVAVIGEAIIDMIPSAEGMYQPCAGGSPYNVARALGLQQVPSCYLSPFSNDDFGALLLEQIQGDGVLVDTNFKVDKPTSLAFVNFDDNGVPRYSLYRDGVADRKYRAAEIISRLPSDLEILHTGSLAIIPDELPKIVEIFLELKARGVLISVDLNCRPNVVEDDEAYITGLLSLVPYCDLLKASDEDLRYLGFENEWDALVREHLEAGEVCLFAITAGDKGASLINQNTRVDLETFPIDHVEDSVGAGDCFQAGMLASLYEHRLLSKDRLRSASSTELLEVLKTASATAAINVSRKGCHPPTKTEVTALINTASSH